jgi:hypothetical protein
LDGDVGELGSPEKESESEENCPANLDNENPDSSYRGY